MAAAAHRLEQRASRPWRHRAARAHNSHGLSSNANSSWLVGMGPRARVMRDHARLSVATEVDSRGRAAIGAATTAMSGMAMVRAHNPPCPASTTMSTRPRAIHDGPNGTARTALGPPIHAGAYVAWGGPNRRPNGRMSGPRARRPPVGPRAGRPRMTMQFTGCGSGYGGKRFDAKSLKNRLFRHHSMHARGTNFKVIFGNCSCYRADPNRRQTNHGRVASGFSLAGRCCPLGFRKGD
jgi:hypothetical protein